MRNVIFAGLLLGGFVWTSATAEPIRERPRVIFEPHGERMCASGCALSRHPTASLSQGEFQELLDRYLELPPEQISPPLEALLFYGPQAAAYLQDISVGTEGREHLSFLARELRRDRVKMEFRIVDENGVVRVHLPPTEVNFDKRFVFEPLLTQDFQPPEASGTVKRVGLGHIWQRI